MDIKTRLYLEKGDITKQKVDAIVNAANELLLGGGGVDGAIHAVAGFELKLECAKLGGCKTGEAKITPGFNLPAKFVIHTVGPRYGQHGGEEANLLRSCYLESLKLAKENHCQSIAFPCISTGVFGYPNQKAAKIAIGTVREFIEGNNCFQKVVFVCYLQEDYEVYEIILKSRDRSFVSNLYSVFLP